jgi:hypothetical protein
MHASLVPALELLFSCLDAPSFKKSPGDKTLNTSLFSQQQTTHFHHVCRIRCNCLETLKDNNPIRHNNPIPSLWGYHHISQHLPKHPDDRPPNQGNELPGRSSFVPGQQRPELSRPVRARSCHDQGHPPLHCPLPTNSHPAISAGTDKNRGGQGIEMRDPWDIYGCYSKIFCTTMTRDDEAAIKVDAARPCSRPCSCSGTKSCSKSGPITRAATPTSILEVLNYKKDKAKNNPTVEAMEETFACIASRPPLPKATKFTVTEAARAAATEELAAAISNHKADFQAMLTSLTVERTPAQENRLRADNVALITSATICIQEAGGRRITLERLYEIARQEERAARQLHGKALATTLVELSKSQTMMSTITDAEGFTIVNCQSSSPFLKANPAPTPEDRSQVNLFTEEFLNAGEDDLKEYSLDPSTCQPTKKDSRGKETSLVTAALSTTSAVSPARVSIYRNKRAALASPAKFLPLRFPPVQCTSKNLTRLWRKWNARGRKIRPRGKQRWPLWSNWLTRRSRRAPQKRLQG